MKSGVTSRAHLLDRRHHLLTVMHRLRISPSPAIVAIATASASFAVADSLQHGQSQHNAPADPWHHQQQTESDKAHSNDRTRVVCSDGKVDSDGNCSDKGESDSNSYDDQWTEVVTRPCGTQVESHHYLAINVVLLQLTLRTEEDISFDDSCLGIEVYRQNFFRNRRVIVTLKFNLPLRIFNS